MPMTRDAGLHTGNAAAGDGCTTRLPLDALTISTTFSDYA
jgi:hypothetical protein